MDDRPLEIKMDDRPLEIKMDDRPIQKWTTVHFLSAKTTLRQNTI